MPSQEAVANAAARRKRIVASVQRAHDRNQAPPTLTELAEEHGVSFQQISKDVARLVEEGRLGRTPGKVRSIHVIKRGPGRPKTKR